MLFKYVCAWFGMMVLAILNGGVRDGVYADHFGALAAHQISTAALLVLFVISFRVLTTKWPLASSRQAWAIGLIWLAMTLVFEFGMGRFVSGLPWSAMFHDYNLFAGRVWVVIPLWVLIGPYLFFRLNVVKEQR